MNNESNHQQGGEPNRKLTALNAVQKAADTLKRRYSDEIPNASISFIPGTPEALCAHRNKKKQKKKPIVTRVPKLPSFAIPTTTLPSSTR